MVVKNPRKMWLFGLAVLLASLTETPAFQLGDRPAEEWVRILETENRIAELKISEVVSRLRLQPGDIVADIGAGSGVFSRALALAVAPKGTLLAVDIDPALLDHIAERAKEANIKNIQPVLGKFDDPNLPIRQVDLAFFHEALHHIERREAYLKALASHLKPQGRIVVIDLIKDHPDAPHKDQPEMQITLDEVKQWMAAAGFYLVEKFDLFDNKFFAAFARKDNR